MKEHFLAGLLYSLLVFVWVKIQRNVNMNVQDHGTTPTLRLDKHQTLTYENCDNIVKFGITGQWPFSKSYRLLLLEI